MKCKNTKKKKIYERLYNETFEKQTGLKIISLLRLHPPPPQQDKPVTYP
jgi:hypothetical protein